MSTGTTIARSNFRLVEHQHDYKWTIENFEYLCPEGATEFPVCAGPSFQMGIGCGRVITWGVEVYGAKGRMIFTFRCQKFGNGDKLPAKGLKGEIELFISSKTDPFFYSPSTKKFTLNDQVRQEKTNRSIKEIYDRRGELLPDGALTVLTRIRVFEEPSLFNFPSVDPSADKKALLDELVNDLKNMRMQALYIPYDFQIQFGENPKDKLQAHKVILAARSPYFRKLLTSDCKEVTEDQVIMESIPMTGFQTVLDYMYGLRMNATGLNPDQILDAIQVADYCLLDSFKTVLFHELVECINDDNVVYLAVVAHTYRAPKNIKDAVANFLNTKLAYFFKDDEAQWWVKQCPEAFTSCFNSIL